MREEGWTALRALGEASRANILVNLARSNRLDDRTRRRVVEALKELLLPGTPKAIEAPCLDAFTHRFHLTHIYIYNIYTYFISSISSSL